MTYERSGTIERAAKGAAKGAISGILATDGEASDGHILDIDGGDLREGSPMLFGHDDWSGERNLGTWESFDKFRTPEGARAIRASGQILLGGDGDRKAWRNDMAYMIQEQAVGALSIRWDPITDPIARTALPTDHAAHVKSTTKGRKRMGLFFPEWRMMEGSVVTLGADASAMIGRMGECEGPVRQFWRSAINSAVAEDASDLVAVRLGNGELAYCERGIYDALLELSNERLNLALDFYEREEVGIDPPESVDDSATGEVVLQQERETNTATLPVVTPRLIYAVLRERLAESQAAAAVDRSAGIARAKGRI